MQDSGFNGGSCQLGGRHVTRRTAISRNPRVEKIARSASSCHLASLLPNPSVHHLSRPLAISQPSFPGTRASEVRQPIHAHTQPVLSCSAVFLSSAATESGLLAASQPDLLTQSNAHSVHSKEQSSAFSRYSCS